MEKNGPLNPSFKKVAWLMLLGVLVLSTLLALFGPHHDPRLRQAVADTRQQLRNQGFKTDLADFDVTTDPAMQARVALLTMFDKPLPLDASGDQLDLLPVATNDTASIIWQQDPLQLRTGTFQWSALRAVLATNREALDGACDAVLSGPIIFDINIGPLGGIWDNHLRQLGYLSPVLNSRVILELHDGNLDAAWTNLLAATRLVTAWKEQPTEIGHLGYSVLATSAFSDTWQALQTNGWRDEQLAALQQEWESANFLTNLSETMAYDRTTWEHHCEQLNQEHPFADLSISRLSKEAFKEPSSTYYELKDAIAFMRYQGNGVWTDEKNLLLYFRDRELEFRHAIQSPTWAEMRAQPGVTNVVPFKSGYAGMMEAMTYFCHSKSLVPMRAAESEARRRILITALALERYRGRHGAYPATLAALAPEFVKTVPVDFMDGQPLRYRLTPDGHFVLYSVGLDCLDDGGKLPDPGAPPFPQNAAGFYIAPTNVDIVWPRPDTSLTPPLNAP
jgi:hypothetical protein